MRAWITRDYDTRLIWSTQPTLVGETFDCDGDYVMGYLRDDEYPEHQPGPGECIEVEVEWLETEEATDGKEQT